MNFEEEYEGRFGTRRAEQLDNMGTLYGLTGHLGDGKSINEAYPQLKQTSADNTPEEAILVSLYYTWNEVSECFIYGQFQAVTVLCRTIAERCLKLQIIRDEGALPRDVKMLGSLLKYLRGKMDPNILSLASEIGQPGNDRAHGNLEMSDPQKAISGGDRGVEVLSPATYLIFPYKGEAEYCIERANQILRAICG